MLSGPFGITHPIKEIPMAFSLDPAVAKALEPMAAAMADSAPPPVGDVDSRRPVLDAIMAQTAAVQPMPTDVKATDFHATATDGADVLLRWYRKVGVATGPAVVYLHGGGMISGSVALYDGPISRYVSSSGVPMLAVEYRLAPEHPYPTPVEDCYSGLLWLAEHAAELDVDPARIAVMGDSAGGGMAAAVALMSRDRGGPALAHQILIYPMLDDRNTNPDPEIVPFAVWSYDDNITGWGALLGETVGDASVSPYAAPARAINLSGLPPCYLEVGQLDIFRDEDLDYAQRLSDAGVTVEFHLRPGVPHEFETYAYATDIARRSVADRIRVLSMI
jgi:acetyl esterase/lipase